MDADDAEPLEQGIIHLVAAGQGSGVAHGELRAELGIAGFQCHQRLAALQRLGGGAAEGWHVLDAFEIKADRRHLRIVGQGIDIVRRVEDRLVARADDVGEGHGTVVAAEIERDVAALHDDRAAGLDLMAEGTGGPQADAVDEVEQPVAIGPDHREVARCLGELRLQGDAFAADLGVTGRVADGSTAAARAQLAEDVDGRLARDRDEGGVRRLWQICDRGVAFTPAQLRIFRVDDPDFAGEAGVGTAPDRIRHRLSADDRDVPRPQQAPQIVLTL